MRAALIYVFIVAPMAACFSPTYREGVECAPTTQECPPGMSCNPRDGRCYRDVPAVECQRDDDCTSGRCDVAAGTCIAAPTCTDGIQNGTESDVDCGGAACPACPVGARCAQPADCESMACAAGLCAPASCGDGVVQEGEACDDGGVSASCDPDCTPVVCGDDLVNAAAGEICEPGRDGCCAATCDVPAAMGSECRAAAGLCDLPEVCDGIAVSCPSDVVVAAGNECRGSAGSCDPAEACTGVSPACPPDQLAAAATQCRPGNGTCDPAEVCDGASPECPSDAVLPDGSMCTDCASGECDACLAGVCVNRYEQSCKALLDVRPGLASGIYTIDPDGAGMGVAPFEVYCDMSTDGGGWTLALVSSDDGQHTWTMDNRMLMTTDQTLIGSVRERNRDFKSLALHSVAFSDLLFVHAPSGVTAAYANVGNGMGSFSMFLEGIAYPVCDLALAGNGYPLTGGTLALGGRLCDTDLYFHLGDHESGVANCRNPTAASNNTTFGPAWSIVNNNQCPFDDPSIVSLGPSSQCANCPAGYSATEENGRGFAWALGLNVGTAGAAQNYLQMLVR